MYICICKGITEEKLLKLRSKGPGQLKEALQKLGVGSDCGICLTEALKRIQAKEASGKTQQNK